MGLTRNQLAAIHAGRQSGFHHKRMTRDRADRLEEVKQLEDLNRIRIEKGIPVGLNLALVDSEREEKRRRLNEVLKENEERRIKFDKDVSREKRHMGDMSLTPEGQFKLQRFKNSLEFSRRYS